MKVISILMFLSLLSCSDAPQQQTNESSEVRSQPEKLKKDHVLKGYQDQIQKAKDMEKEILKAAERQKKAIDDASK